MAIPIIIGVAAAGAAVYGAVKGTKGAIDQSDAKNINRSSGSIVEEANRSLEKQREATNSVIEDYGNRKLRAFESVISDFISAFQQLKNVELENSSELDKLQLGEFQTHFFDGLKNDYELLKSSGMGLAAGVTSGAALAFGAYSGTMLLATASTGTAISALSGVAATNATLAWLGGGSLAAGGFGMAGGMMVLGGIVAGPALAVFGHIVGNKGEEALNNARANHEEAKRVEDETTLMVEKLKAVETVAALANKVFSSVSSRLRRSVGELRIVIEKSGANYLDFSEAEKSTVFQAVKYAQLIKAMIDTPILDEDGNLVLSTEKVITEIQAII